MPKVTRTRRSYGRRAYSTPYVGRRASTSYSQGSSASDSQSINLFSQGTQEARISRVSSILKNPRLTYAFERTMYNRLGCSTTQGFTLANGLSPLGQGMALSFQLGQMKFWGSTGSNSQISVPNYTEFTNLFDEWKIDYVKVKIQFTNNFANTTAANPSYQAASLPLVLYATDLDDDVAPTNLDIMTQYQNLKTRVFDSNGPEYCQFKPKAQLATEAGNILATGYASNYGGWLNTSSTGTDYMGMKFWLDLSGTSTDNHFGDMIFIVTYGLKFRGVK